MKQVIDFQLLTHGGVSPIFTQMDIRVLSKVYEAMEPLAFHRVIALLRTDRNHERKTHASSFILHFPIHGQYRRMIFGSSPQSIHFYLSFNLSCSALCIFVAKFHATLLSQSACREVSSVVVPQNWVRKDFAREIHLFG